MPFLDVATQIEQAPKQQTSPDLCGDHRRTQQRMIDTACESIFFDFAHLF
jgi:hypothetical protein